MKNSLGDIELPRLVLSPSATNRKILVQQVQVSSACRMAIKKIPGCFREQASRPNGSNPKDERPSRHDLPFRNHGGFAQAGVSKHLDVHLPHGKYGEPDKRQFDIKIRVRESLGGVSGQEEQARRDVYSEARPHDAEEPLERLEREVGRDAKNSQV